MIIIWLLTKFWNHFAFRDVTHSRSLSRHRAFIGDTLDYTISLTNEKIVPLIWVDIQDSFPAELELLGASLRGTGTELTKEHRITSSLLPYQRVSWKYSLRCDHRGYHRIGPARLRSGDIFGFTAAEVHLTQVEHLLVYPRLVELEQLVWPSEHPLGESKGHLPIYQDSSRFIGLRDYDPSDPMKHIDWKATARRSTIQTKKYEPVVALKVLIALNGPDQRTRLARRQPSLVRAGRHRCGVAGQALLRPTFQLRLAQQRRGGLFGKVDQLEDKQLGFPIGPGAGISSHGRSIRGGFAARGAAGRAGLHAVGNYRGHRDFLTN